MNVEDIYEFFVFMVGVGTKYDARGFKVDLLTRQSPVRVKDVLKNIAFCEISYAKKKLSSAKRTHDIDSLNPLILILWMFFHYMYCWKPRGNY